MDNVFDDLSMLEVFQVEAREHLDQLTHELVNAPGDSPGPDGMARMMRELHTLKGAARVVDLRSVQQLSHALESELEKVVREHRMLCAEEVDGFLVSLDLIASAVESAVRSQPPPDLAQVIGSLESGGLPALAALAPERMLPERGSDGGPVERDATASVRFGDQLVRVPVEEIDRLLRLTGELHVTRMRLARVLRQFQNMAKPVGRLAGDWRQLASILHDDSAQAVQRRETLVKSNSRAGDILRKEFEAELSDLDEVVGQLERVNQDLSDRVLQARMLPIGYLFEPFPRLIRDLAGQLGKRVDLHCEGARTRVDRNILEALRKPLIHLLQNAVDHGAETPEQRAAAGKTEAARITLKAHYSGDMLLVEVSDDGRGVDLRAVRERAVEAGLMPAWPSVEPPAGELFKLLFRRGFTTAREVTPLSGRGVGLEAVRSALDALRGQMEIESSAGLGTTMRLRLPLTVAVTRVLLAKASGVLYAIPVDQVRQLLSVKRSTVQIFDEHEVLMCDGRPARLHHLSAQLGMPEARGWHGEDQHVVLLAGIEGETALGVDRLIEEEDVVIKPLDVRLGRIRGVLGAAVTRAGEVALVLDVPGLLARIDEAPVSLVRLNPRRPAGDRYHILVVEDSRTTREVNRRMLAGAGYAVSTARDGLEALDVLNTEAIDLVLTDLNMPGLDGFGLTRRVRNDRQLSRIPVVILSYKSREEDRKRAQLLGASAYLVKEQSEADEILSTLSGLLEGQEPVARRPEKPEEWPSSGSLRAPRGVDPNLSGGSGGGSAGREEEPPAGDAGPESPGEAGGAGRGPEAGDG